jgi:hypothetical protein
VVWLFSVGRGGHPGWACPVPGELQRRNGELKALEAKLRWGLAEGNLLSPHFDADNLDHV